MTNASNPLNPLQQLNALGQGVWLDFVDRRYLTEGGLAKLIAEDGITGVTSNPAIFEKAMGRSDNYDADLRALLMQSATSTRSNSTKRSRWRISSTPPTNCGLFMTG